MKLPDRIIGFLDYNDSKCPYEFDKDSFELRLYYPTESDAYEQVLSGIKSYAASPIEHKWVEVIKLIGKTSEGYRVYFETSANPDSYNGYRVYDIDLYYISNNDSDPINEIRFYGQEINYFYDPARVFKREIMLQNEKTISSKYMKVQTTNSEALDCGRYQSGESTVEAICKAEPIMNPSSSTPLDSKSYLSLKFSNQLSVDEVINKALYVHRVLKYVCYRNNIHYEDVSTYIKLNDGRNWNCGKLVFKEKCQQEKSENARKRIIRADLLHTNFAKLMDIIEKEEITYGHICDSISDMSCYSVSRIIMILAAFEREFRIVYGPDVRRSELYKETKDKVFNLVQDYANSLSGKSKKYVIGFANGIKNHDSSYGDNCKYALEDCSEIMKPFVTKRFDGTYEEIIDEVSISINNLRNGIAHNKLDFEIEARNIAEIKIVERLLYAIRLKNLGLDPKDIQLSISELFGEKVNM